MARIGVLLVSLVLVSGGPAMAQTGPGAASPQGGILPMREILSLVSEQGFEPLSQPVRQGERYVLLAVDEVRGIEMRLVVDGWTGDVLRARPRGFDPPESVRSGFIETALPRANVPGRGVSERGLSPSGALERRAALQPAAQAKPVAPTPRPRPPQASGVASGEPAHETMPPLAPTEPLKPIAKIPAAGEAASARSATVSGEGKTGKDAALPPVAPLE